ncbi:MAG: alcohol dehydrogenase catalytic domain-containing protein [Actinomycetota bacterium]
MHQLLFEGPGVVRWAEAEEPTLDDVDGGRSGRGGGAGRGGGGSIEGNGAPLEQVPGPGAAVVRPIAVALCDLDVGVLRGDFPLPGPYPLGHEGVAEVVAIGPEVRSVRVGDRVIVPFQISCGECAPCRRGRTGNCALHPPMSTFGLGTMGGLQWGGLLADRALVPHADGMLVRLPNDVDPVAVASMGDNIADGWRCVGPQLAEEPRAHVLVVAGDAGPNSIGLYAAGLAVAAGSERVVYLDDDPERGALAEALGAEVLTGPPPRRVGSFPITVDASGSSEGLCCALESTASDGRCTSPSVYLGDQAVPMLSMYSRCCTLHTGRAHARPAIPEVLDLVAAGFDPSIVTTDVVEFADAEAALAEPSMKPVLVRP